MAERILSGKWIKQKLGIVFFPKPLTPDELVYKNGKRLLPQSGEKPAPKANRN